MLQIPTISVHKRSMKGPLGGPGLSLLSGLAGRVATATQLLQDALVHSTMGVSENKGYLTLGHNKKDPTIQGTTMRVHFGNPQIPLRVQLPRWRFARLGLL